MPVQCGILVFVECIPFSCNNSRAIYNKVTKRWRVCNIAAARDFSFMPALADADNVLYGTIKHKILNSQVQMKKTEAFTMVELLVVIFNAAILTVIGTPLIRGRNNSAKWSEAETGAGTIRAAVRTLHS